MSNVNPTHRTYFVTKYALTEGIWEVQPGDADLTEDGKYLYVGGVGRLPIQVPKKDFFLDLREAQSRVEFLVWKKLGALGRQIAVLQKYEPAVKVWRRK